MLDFESLPLMGILRGIHSHEIAPLAETVVKAGLKALEITMNTPEAPALIRSLVAGTEGHVTIGAGTVLSLADYDQALKAGARFIVMPTLVREVVSRCQEDGIPVFPGALTPQEIFDAYNAGATMVKVFPANLFGPAYFKDVLGPFNHVPLLACGGVNAETVAAFFDHGAKGASFGGSIFRREWFTAGDYDRIGEALKRVIRAYQTAVTT